MTKAASQIKYTGNSQEAGSACYRCHQRKPFPGGPAAKIRVAVFFDGTLNNRTNTWLGEQGTVKDHSYKNALTNVAILELYYRQDSGYDYSFSLYVEGIGTTDEKTDSTKAAVLGQGKTGILDKVEKGIFKVTAQINKLLEPDREIECLHLDCFGFSRGAAAARNFIYSAVLRSEDTLKHRLESLGHATKESKVKFVGLYDTVASYGINHRNDTHELHLDSVKHAESVVQLAAADEHRKYFPLTNINSAPHGVQLFLPGSHSDIGGGYANNMAEVNYQIMFVYRQYGLSAADKAALRREREWLQAMGWYYENEIHPEVTSVPGEAGAAGLPLQFGHLSDSDSWDEVKVTRRAISNHFHRIPLKMMAELATGKGIGFLPALKKKYPISLSLQKAEKLIRESPLSSSEYWWGLRTKMMKDLRHQYLHFSACFGSVMGCNQPQFSGDDAIAGHRKREVFNG